jgi:hypothetical protein
MERGVFHGVEIAVKRDRAKLKVELTADIYDTACHSFAAEGFGSAHV